MTQPVRATRGGIRELSPVLIAAGLAVLFLFTPLAWPCPLRMTTGLPCPSCGMTRATRLALHGDFAGATRMHPLWFVVVPALAAIVIAEVVAFARVGRWGAALENRWVARAGIAILAALVAVWLARFWGAFGGPVPR